MPDPHEVDSAMPPSSPRTALLTLDQAAEHLGVSTRTVRRYVAAGHLTAHRLGPRLIRLHADQLDRMLRTIPTASTAA